MPIEAVIVTEDEVEDEITFRDEQHRKDFEEGFTAGCKAYGAGSYGVYTLDDEDFEDLEEELKEAIRARLNRG